MKNAQRKSVNLSLDAGLVSQAKALDLNLSRISAEAIAEAVRAEAARRWQADNAAAIEDYNKRVDASGLPSDHIEGWWKRDGAV